MDFGLVNEHDVWKIYRTNNDDYLISRNYYANICIIITEGFSNLQVTKYLWVLPVLRNILDVRVLIGHASKSFVP